LNRYKLLNHTADIGIIAFGKDLSEAFANAAYAMFDLITDISSIRKSEKSHIQVKANNIEDLLVAWLDELLYRYETERMIYSHFVVDNMSEQSLDAHVFGEKLNTERHEVKTEIKSVTYHQLKVAKTGETWEVQVIFDV
jgi:SHS2 domain-containing protein